MQKIVGLVCLGIAILCAWTLGSGQILIVFLKAVGFVLGAAAGMTILFLPKNSPEEKENEKQIENFTGKTDSLIHELKDLATVLRRDGMIAAEGFVQKIHDPLLQRLVQYLMEGFESDAIQSVIDHRRNNIRVQFNTNDVWMQDLADRCIWAGIIGVVVTAAVATAPTAGVLLMPFGVGFLCSGIVQALNISENRSARWQFEEYLDLISIALAGMSKGLHADMIEAQMVSRVGRNPPAKQK